MYDLSIEKLCLGACLKVAMDSRGQISQWGYFPDYGNGLPVMSEEGPFSSFSLQICRN